MYQKIFHHLLKKNIQKGRLIVNFHDKEFVYGSGIPEATLTIKNPAFFSKVITRNELGFGESYVAGDWESDQLSNVLLIIFLNINHFLSSSNLLLFLSMGLYKIMRASKRLGFSEEDSKKGMSISYDVGNDIFHYCLGKTMTYTCAIFKNKQDTIDEAQQHKINIIMQKLALSPKHKVLDIGCGWGTLLQQIHEKYKCEVRGIALAKEQIQYCKDNYSFGQFDFLDYRHLDEINQYDRIVSVGMIEHVGYDNLQLIMQKIATALKPNGRALLHMMIKGPRYSRKCGTHSYIPSFYGTYIMPVGYIPYDWDITDAIVKTNSFRIIHQEKFGIHYGETVQRWRNNVLKNANEIEKLGSKEIVKAYDYAAAMYSSCFTSGFIDLYQILIEKNPITFEADVWDPRSV